MLITDKIVRISNLKIAYLVQCINNSDIFLGKKRCFTLQISVAIVIVTKQPIKGINHIYPTAFASLASNCRIDGITSVEYCCCIRNEKSYKNTVQGEQVISLVY